MDRIEAMEQISSLLHSAMLRVNRARNLAREHGMEEWLTTETWEAEEQLEPYGLEGPFTLLGLNDLARQVEINYEIVRDSF